MADDTGNNVVTIERILNSALESADEAEEVVLEVARRSGFTEDDLHKIGVSVRESIVNAVVHGNRYNGRKKVHLSVSNSAGRLTILIRDEGEGFDLTLLPDPLAEDNLLQQSGRGIFLIRTFMDEFGIRRLTPRGTEVRLVKYLGNQ